MSATVDPTTQASVPDDAGSGGGAPEEDAALARRRRNLRQSARDMVLSMLVIVGIVAVIWALVPRPNAQPIRAVDVSAAAVAATPDLGFTPAVPAVPAGWVATSAGVRRAADGITTWHIGYITADGHYAGVEQAVRVTDRWIEIMTSGGTGDTSRTVDGTAWEEKYKDVRDVVSYLHRGPDRTTLITSKGGGVANADVLARSIPAALR